MRVARSTRLAAAAFATALSGFAANALADTITVSGAQSGQFSTATQVLEFNAQTNTMTFTVTNTSAITQPGSTSSITAIGFDLPPLGNASASGLNGFTGTQAPSLSSTFTFSDADLGAVPGFGAVLDFGFLTGASFTSGSVLLGLLPGESASFTVTGAGFSGFTEAELANSVFMAFQNVPTAAGSNGFDVAAVAAPNSVPEPATALLIGLALAGFGLGAARRTR